LKHSMDFATSFLDPTGKLLVEGLSMPAHLGSMPPAVASIRDTFGDDIRPGDVYLLNDPYSGGMHLPDLFVVKPVFTSGDLLAFAATTAHHADIGGRTPGSMAYDSTEIYQEGLRIPPVRLFEGGQPSHAVFALLMQNTRLPSRVGGDLNAQLAACATGERELLALCDRYGSDVMRAIFRELLEYAARLGRAALARMPEGTWRFTDHIDNDGIVDAPIAIEVAITLAGGEAIIDFEGTSPQAKGAINPSFSLTQSIAYAALRCVLDGDIPPNSGFFDLVDVRAPLGCLVNPKPPASCAARGITLYRMADAIFGALAQAVPDRVRAAGEGGTSNIRISTESADGAPIILMDIFQGTWGAAASSDGYEGLGNPMVNHSNTPVEAIEQDYPILIDTYGFVPDSGGPGRFRGGVALERAWRFLGDEGMIQLRSDRRAFPPYGLFEGEPGMPSATTYRRQDGSEVELPAKATQAMRRGEVLWHRIGGGGGFGDPLERDPELVLTDFVNEMVTSSHARDSYGVVIDQDGPAVDAEATAMLRAELRRRASKREG